jgi:hypothetical protein
LERNIESIPFGLTLLIAFCIPTTPSTNVLILPVPFAAEAKEVLPAMGKLKQFIAE